MFRIRPFLTTTLVLMVFFSLFAQQEVTREKLVAAYVYRFAENIDWPADATSADVFKIQVIGGTEDIRQNFDAMASKREVSGKPLQVSYSQEYKSSDAPNMVYVVGDKRQFVEKLLELIRGSYILLITENYPDREQIMINFVDSEDDSKVTFELNYQNILAQGLEVAPELIVMGGDQEGLIELYEKSKEELENKNQSIQELEENIDALAAKITEQTQQIQDQKSLMLSQQETIDQQLREITKQESVLLERQQQSEELVADIEEQRVELAFKQQQLTKQADNLAEMRQELAAGEQSLKMQLVRTDSLNNVIDDQIDQVGKLSDELNKNRQFVILLSVSLFLGLALIFVILLAYRNIRRTNKELEIQKTNLIHAEKMASIGTLAAGVAHELNNPLNVVAGTLQFFESSIQRVLEDGTKLDKEDKEDMLTLLDDSRSSVKRALQIISGLNMSVSSKTTPSTIDLSEIVDNVVALFETKVDDKIEFDVHTRRVVIDCFPDRIHYVISSIIDNAVKAITENNVTDRKITIRAFQRQKEAVLEISNNGPKIPERIMEKIYDPFFTTREPGSGNGLGLYNSYNIVKQHQGEIEIDNSESAVSFKIILPQELKGYDEVLDSSKGSFS